MKICPHCMRSFEDEALFCPLDGIALKETKDPYIGETFIGQFEIRERCGQGSMGSVYRAWQISMEREVAIKVLRRDLLRNRSIVKRFQREARASARLSHPSIITVYLVGAAEDGAPFLAMEFLKGRSLDEICKEEGPLAPVRAVHVARQITSALAEAHGRHIIHRDLKPENIFLTNTKHTPDFVKVLDFGIAKILYENNESLLTQTGAIFGTPYYLAPEQAAGGDLDHRCDLYALGVLLFLMTTGSLPFQGSSGMAVLIQHLQEPPPRPRDLNKHIPRALEQLILKSLEKSPDDRFQSAEEMGRALEEVLPTFGDGQARLGDHPAPVYDAKAIPSASREEPRTPATQEHVQAPEGGMFDEAEASERAVEATTPEEAAELTSPEPAAERPQCDTIRGTGAPLVRALAAPAAASGEETIQSTPPLAETIMGPGSTQMLARRVLRRRSLFTHLIICLTVIASGSALGAVLGWHKNRAAKASEPASASAPSKEAAPPPPARDAEAPSGSDAAQAPRDLELADTAAASKPVIKKKSGASKRPRKTSSRRRPSRRAGGNRLPNKQPNRKPSWTIKGSKQRGAGSDFQPAGPDPAISGSDHGDDPSPQTPDPAPAPTPKTSPRTDSQPLPGAAPIPPKAPPRPTKKRGEGDSFYDLVE